MRLTLRTLLAYLDDRLPPANAREIGQKIARSPFATELTERIRDVVRRRRLAAPEKPTPMIDPNLVAEYLDDQLTPELVARIEREILQSDSALAEVAAAHEILGLLREPVALEPQLRDRLYALDPSGKLEVVQTLAGGAFETTTVQPVAPAPEWQPLANRPQLSGRLQVAIIVGMAIVWVVVLLTDSALFSSGPVDPVVAQVDQRPDQPGPDSVDPAANQNARAGGRDPADLGTPDGTVTSQAETIAPLPADTSSAADAAGTPPTAAAGTPVAAADSVATDPESDSARETRRSDILADSSTVPGDVPPPPIPHGQPAADGAMFPIYLTDEYRMCLLLTEGESNWTRAVGKPGAVSTDQLRLRDWRDHLKKRWLGVPAAYQIQLAVSGSGWRSLIPGATVVQVINQRDAGMALSEGRLLVSRDTAAEIPDDAPVPFVLNIGLSSSPLMLMTADTRFAVEVIPVSSVTRLRPLEAQESDPDQDAAEDSEDFLPLTADRHVLLAVIQGRLQLAAEDGAEPSELLKAQALSWRVLESGDIADVAMVSASPQNTLPEWIFRSEADVIPERKTVLAQAAAGFSTSDGLAATARNLSQDRNPQVGIVAVGVASLMRDVETLMTILMESGEELVRRAAIDGLSLSLNQTPDGPDRVRRALETRMPMNEVPVMMKLLTGLNEQDVRNPSLCGELLNLLSHDRVATREVAFYRMESAARDRFGYNAEIDSGRRREAVRRWQRYLDKNEGKLVL